MKTIRTVLSTALCILASSALFAASKHIDNIEASFDATNLSLVEARTFGGNLEVVGEDREDVSIAAELVVKNASDDEATAIFEEIEKTIEIRDNTLYVKFEYDRKNSWSFRNLFDRDPSVSVNIKIAAPKTLGQDLRTSGGNIEVNNLSADVKAKTSGGNMRFEVIDGNLNANTSGGNIKANEIKGAVTLHTSGGHIELDSISGTAEVRTSGGNITLENMFGATVAKTSGGNIKAEFPEGIPDTTDLRTSGGSVTARLPADQSFHLNASTSGGRVSTDFPVKMQGKIISSKAEGDVNGGGSDLNLHTSGGSIHVKYL